MLILTRRVGEKVSIGDDVVVTVLAVKGNQIRLGIDAPRETLIVREELYEKQARPGKGAINRERLTLATDLRARA